VNLQSLAAQANLIEQSLGIVHPSLGVDITIQVMAGSLQSAGHKDAVGSPLKGPERVQDVELAGTGQFHDFDIGRVREAHRACQVGGSVGAIVTGKGQNLGFEVGHRELLIHFRFEIYILTSRTKQFGVFFLRELPFAASEELALV